MAMMTQAERTLRLTAEEAEVLFNILEEAHRAKEIEVHRTEAFDYKKRVEQESTILRNILDRLRST